MPETLRIGFLGAGKMAGALAQGFLRAGLAAPDRLWASDPYESARRQFAELTQGQATESNGEVASQSDILILAVKPDQAESVLGGIKERIEPKHLVISIAAGVRLSKLEAALGGSPRVVRVMPNTPALVGASATGFALGSHARAGDAQTVERLFSAVGIALAVKESLLDAVTGLSGSGPAYACLMIEALSDGGVAAGLSRDTATKLAVQTLLGTAKMVLETGQHPGVLKDMVTSPGGTTIEGLHELEKGGLRAALMNAVRAASEKSKRLGQS
ncbi:MAG: pyrroline-5-carboxylate reductase [Verrucomicrobia bacterium]|nr:pyrroline-5-carboxylate reductase [Verrucomicrobiota bacterium]